jgi:hypothetical protein
VIAMMVFAAMLFAMPHLTAFLVATAYVLSGPTLLIRGERMSAKIPVLRPVGNAKPHDTNGAEADTARRTRSLHEHQSESR